MRQYILMSILISESWLSGCSTTRAAPKELANFDCQTLSDLSHIYTSSLSNIDIFNDNDTRNLERKNNNRILSHRPNVQPHEKNMDSIREASHIKGC